MLRILLPVAVIAILLFTPIFGGAATEVGGIEKVNTVTGYDYVGNTIQCFRDGAYSIDGDCKPKGDAKGLAIFGAVFMSAVAAALGVIGLLPVIGRLTSVVTTLAGVAVIAAIGFYAMTQLGTEEGMSGFQWGAYAGGGGGLLTLIAGLAGMRGRD